MITNKHNEECSCALFDRQTLNAGAGSWTNSMDWHCPVHGQQHRDYKKPEGWGGDWTPQQQHEWSQSIKLAMKKQNEHKVEPHLVWDMGHNCPTDSEGFCDDCPCHSIPSVPHGVISTDMVVTPKSKYDNPNYKSDFDKYVEAHPITDVSWEAEVKKCFLTERMTDWPIPTVRVNPDTLMEIIKHQIDLAREESKHITKSGRVMYMGGKREAFGQALKILEEELVLAHTTVSGKTSRLTSAFVRIEHLRDDSEALSNK